MPVFQISHFPQTPCFSPCLPTLSRKTKPSEGTSVPHCLHCLCSVPVATVKIPTLGIPGWRSGLVPAFGPGSHPGDPGSNPTSGSWCMEPASPSACVSASLSLSLCDYINKFLKKFKKKEHRFYSLPALFVHSVLCEPQSSHQLNALDSSP